MAITFMHRRTSPNPRRLPIKTTTLLPHPPTPATKYSLFTFVLLLLLTIISLSTIFSNSFHICISSPRNRSFCISGGSSAGSGANAAFSGDKQTSHTDISFPQNATFNSSDRSKEIADAIIPVEQYLRTIRSWSVGKESPFIPSCDGNGVFVYDLPAKFNTDILSKCDALLPWADLCDYLINGGLGMPIPDLGPGWYLTHQYALEPIFHSRVLNHHCRVSDPAKARLFYVPFYAGLDVLRWHFAANASVENKDELGGELVRWLEARPEWAAHGGRDHMFVLGKISWDFHRVGSWGTNFLSLPQMERSYKFLIERQPWEVKEIGIPHPTHFHPHSDEDIERWQERVAAAVRRTMVSFVGASRPEASGSIRSALIKQCVAAAGDCDFVDCGGGRCGGAKEVVETFMGTEFCLQPPGDSPTRKSVFDGMVAGCIPVIFNKFTAYYQYPWHLPEDHRRYSVYIDEDEVRNGRVDVMGILRMVEPDKREEMRRYIIYQLLPGLVYGDGGSKLEKFRDAFGIVMDNMMGLLSMRDAQNH